MGTAVSPLPPPPLPQTLSYQTPMAYEPTGVWAQGNLVMVNDCITFPPRCIGCNGNVRLKMRPRTLNWVPWYVYLAVLPALIPGLLLLAVTQRQIRVKMGTCVHCRRKVMVQQLITLGIVFTSFVAFWMGAVIHRYFALAGLGILLAGVIYGVVATRMYTVVRIRKGVATLRGLGQEFVASLDQA